MKNPDSASLIFFKERKTEGRDISCDLTSLPLRSRRIYLSVLPRIFFLLAQALPSRSPISPPTILRLGVDDGDSRHFLMSSEM